MKDGGTAFPETYTKYGADESIEVTSTSGMTLRDYFAARAMQALLSNDSFVQTDACKIAAYAYTQADAMLEARK